MNPELHPKPAPARRWWHEPLLHFLLLGALVFALDAVLSSGREDRSLIVLNAQTDGELRQLFSTEHGRSPSEAELAPLRQRWFDNELLYREGLAMGLDRGDTGIRERVIFKALNVVQANLGTPQADEATLNAWFERQRTRYDEPPRVDFLEAVIPGQPARDEVEAFVRELNAGRADTRERGLRVYRGRPMASVRDGFGPAFTELVSELPLNRWQVLDSRDGPRAILIEARRPGAPAVLAAMRDRVLQDWRDQRMAELRSGAVRALAQKYTLQVAAHSGVQTGPGVRTTPEARP